MFYSYLTSGAGTIGPVVAGVPSELSLTPTHDLIKKFWEEHRLLSFDMTRAAQKTRKKIGGDTQIHREQGDLISLLLFSK
jgi:hypothetical protein